VHDETIAIHGGFEVDSTRSAAVPIYQTVAHDFIDADHAAAIFDLEIPGFHYNRILNPTNATLERRLAAIDNAPAALTLSSGSAAVAFAVRNLTTVGCNVVSTPQLYAATYMLFAHVLREEGVEVRFAADEKAESVAALIDDNTRAVFCESIGNPAGNLVDIAAVASAAHERGVPLLVDNTVATSVLLKPVDYGADVVIHSLTKFVGGHGTTLGGAIIDAGTFPWHKYPERFPMFSQPDPAYHGVVYNDEFPTTGYIVRCRAVGMRNQGAVLSPFSAFLLLQGLETLPLRLERHIANGRAVAAFLRDDPRISWVNYPGFDDHPQHELAERYLGGHYPSVFTFGVEGGYDAAMRFFNAVELLKRLVNLGDAKSLVAHPASTTHRQLPPEALQLVGVAPDMVRVSIGLEHIDDIIADIDQALAKAVH
jgi:O-acetylhomoserine (thiol)-lyase